MSAPRLIFLAGPNGAGKSTFFKLHLRSSGLQFINADELATRMSLPNEEVARFTDGVRATMLTTGESFITETVFSDPVGAKLQYLRDAIAAGYDVELIYIGLSDAFLSEARVTARVLQGGHDVPSDRLERRYARSLANLKEALKFMPRVTVYDNSSSDDPYRLTARQNEGKRSILSEVPEWLRPVPG